MFEAKRPPKIIIFFGDGAHVTTPPYAGEDLGLLPARGMVSHNAQIDVDGRGNEGWLLAKPSEYGSVPLGASVPHPGEISL